MPPLATPDEPSLNYSIKELLERMRQEQSEGFGRVFALLDSKADKAAVEALRTQMDRDVAHLHARINTIDGDLGAIKGSRDAEAAVLAEREHVEREQEDARTARADQFNRVWPVVLAVAALGTLLWQVFHG